MQSMIMATRSSNFDGSFHMLLTFDLAEKSSSCSVCTAFVQSLVERTGSKTFSPRRNCTTSDSEQTPYTSTPSTTAASEHYG